MKIVFTGGGTGGHFYPIIAVAQKVNQIIDKENIIGVKLYYFSDDPYDKEMLFENGLIFEKVYAGKMRTYFSIKNFFDMFRMFLGSINAIYKIFSIYPDVVFGKGGYASFPTILAARILRIPIIIHESDSTPGRVNKWAGHFVKKIAISFKEAVDYFPKKFVVWTGHPIRTEIEHPIQYEEALNYFKLESNLPVILVLGGSQGAELINNIILDALPRLLNNFQIIHQIGVNNFNSVSARAKVILEKKQEKARYLPFAFLNPLTMKMAAGAATIVVSRAGSTIFEIASWGIPSILIPITKTNGDHQRKNAFNYAHTGACKVIEEANMTANILSSEIERIVEDKEIWNNMANSAKAFNKPDAAYKIARELIDTVLSHEK
ncbi:MAG: UDP diphospho-muramoyl pentapeptide beta-N acetylglucosaminyl transferase [Candidatus Nomurabacteria bacterium GW2011_GWE1_32_28]|uniref:UDP-N-acetylglucosamine--N-acetylmuramyl-(pentapeptide) pyrophosphoryl-undecaprenol N-acetylglucosamine transferase n=1 Tax=Candidatus Nomurabacteria bacterium GW2011_GWF1_31_48 TaxID=1618767 RepID=A0A0F9YVT0_9BACT|nr:MAG: UDP diphospho-muramoyl pentapeptide beta-N acetylglucosaminyl transferase [Candidatus Nomurabacteria bacterium GW2011_GWF2_30_133]KKP29024.1 MAG: UDP-N-acetylglucosamine-N-acetylmuramyl-(pentapeptide) pyrophosphoryl-undecaprenol N-acetylglucosamine transferase [Candidatus Nomurabacteria bacterium GW2011_GWE2_31_40]KKP30566.1 MAG: UDP diphospho-muramoyl pentapeptide beta-N acetylglucosaminyl transferase [Candidatus Nomurabacteria bacterium GW2011_GWF1_31_48]KKP35051.1 MAG: UDP diphospho-m